ncbi:ATP synthase F0 subunit 6 (mitochondrion) [Ogataea philodendri]|uniref:ATP synthase subunit a n=1 Tax=Ogataea philodendri TaxID=1378263 RepID=S5U4W3_9ASCO|nr:ATP synthase F0 subunit 6 [Ogataea philodendri]YP_008475095.1 ATP synthase F0 subunit 6 [Ogataea philodendri]AGS44402.1 ATP synthase F0 subunit 6 [Ogataea philodendri]AGS44403.1 ATP synthase F0 subunit 6 [Ogataea philodendri]
MILNNWIINSPLDQFIINNILEINSPFINLSTINISTFSIYTILVLLVIYYLFKLSIGKNLIKGSNWLISIEAVFDTILNMVKGQIGGSVYGRYIPLIYTLFSFILIANLIGMVPYNFALSASLIFIIGISVSLWIGLTILGLFINKFIFFSLFVPSGTPLPLVPVLVLIELLSYTARAISLGLRLGANTLSGHLLMSILSNLVKNLMSINYITLILGFIPLLGIFAIVILEFAIACIQAYVFAILTSSYLKDSIYLH